MKTSDIKEIQREIGVDDDGFFGPKSRKAALKFLKGLAPTPFPWPKDNDKDIKAFFGDFGEEGTPERAKWERENITSIDVSHLKVYYIGKEAKSIRCHRKVADSLLAILNEISETCPEYPEVLEGYMGCWMIRKKKLGSSPSRHSWAIAIDLSVPGNGLHTNWPHKATMPWKVIKIFAKYGWMSGGAVWNLDAQHFQATNW